MMYGLKWNVVSHSSPASVPCSAFPFFLFFFFRWGSTISSSKKKKARTLITFQQEGIVSKRVSMGWWLLRLTAKILALLRLSVNFFQLRLTKKLKINFFCFKKLNINQPVFFVSLNQNKGLWIITGWNNLFFWKILTSLPWWKKKVAIVERWPLVAVVKRLKQDSVYGPCPPRKQQWPL